MYKIMMQKKIILCLLGLLSLAPSTHAAVLRPSIVLIFVDDMGYGDLGAGVHAMQAVNDVHPLLVWLQRLDGLGQLRLSQ